MPFDPRLAEWLEARTRPTLKLTAHPTGGNRDAEGLKVRARAVGKPEEEVLNELMRSESMATADTLDRVGITLEAVTQDSELAAEAVGTNRRGVSAALHLERPIQKKKHGRVLQKLSWNVLEDEARYADAKDTIAAPFGGPPFEQTAVLRRLIVVLVDGGRITGKNPIPKEEQQRRGLRKLTPREKAALSLHAYEGLTFKEVAARMGITRGGASSTYYRAVAKLQRNADGLGLDEETLYFFDNFPQSL